MIKKCWIPTLGGYMIAEYNDEAEDNMPLNQLQYSLREPHEEEVTQI